MTDQTTGVSPALASASEGGRKDELLAILRGIEVDHSWVVARISEGSIARAHQAIIALLEGMGEQGFSSHPAQSAAARGTHPAADEAALPLSTPLAVELPFYLEQQHYAAAGDAVVKLGLPCHHDKITDAVWGALREEGRHTALTTGSDQ
jgi:hypothetical protein